jgi:Zn-dependent protease with chaperone function
LPPSACNETLGVYSNFLYFIIVFSLFSFSEISAVPVLGLSDMLGCVLILYALFYLITKLFFVRLEKAYSAGSPGAFSNLHGSLINRCTIFAVFVYAVFVYVLDLKSSFTTVPLLAWSDFIQSLLAAVLFFAFLVIIWICAYPSYRHFFNTGASLRGYVLSHARFNSAIIAPWIIFSLIIDCTRLLPPAASSRLTGSTPAGYAFMACLFVAMGVFFPPLLVRLWGCKPISHGLVRIRLAQFCAKAKFSYAEMLEWNLFEGKLITAGVLGFVPKFRYLLISPALLDLLDEHELEAVVAHEIGHVKRHHMLFYLLFVLGYSLFAYSFFSTTFYYLLSQDFVFNLAITAEGRPGPILSFLGVLILLAFLLVYFRLLFGLFSRNFERQADGYSCLYTGSGSGIIQSLEKIAFASSQSRNAPNWHHFTIRERIDYMRSCTDDSSLIKEHDLRVKRLIASYCAVLLLTASALFLSGGSFTGGSELSVLQKITERRAESDPGDPLLHYLLGNIYFEQEDYGRAESSYLAALSLTPDNAEALNNLAWLYATAKDPDKRNPSKALLFAGKAAELDPKPHILDTLAESYFVNGDFRRALEIIDEALAQKPANRPYFEKQRFKFQEHLDAVGTDPSGGDDASEQESEGVAI